jgi:ADP-ribosylglycohydrolase
MTSQLPTDYADRVYAGWLGKVIGVRFGAPLENWTYDDIRKHLGELDWYAFNEAGKVFKPDDDTAVPMIFIRALEDYGLNPTVEQLGDTLLNYIGDQHGTFWWGGYGISTEHTAYANLAAGIPAPRSGSIAQNGATLAEQIGGQIFSDIWGLIAPNDPARAAEMAGRMSSVTHDGAAIDGGRFIAALVSAAFSEADPGRLVETGLAQVTPDGEFARVVRAMVDFHRDNPTDWRACYAYLKANFGYDRYGGVVHIIPNAGIVAMGLLYGEGDFSKTIRITNMGGWDTDCNVGNVGCIMGVAQGVDAIDSRWREPINDVLVAASLIGTRNILTIPQCVDLFVALGQRLHGEPPQPAPRYHFQYPGSLNAFQFSGDRAIPTHRWQDSVDGVPVLRASVRKLNKKGEMHIYTRTSYRASELSANSYAAQFTPLIVPGQTVRARVHLPDDAPPEAVYAALYVLDSHSGEIYQAEGVELTPGEWRDLEYTIPPLTDVCFSQVGVALRVLEPVWERGSLALAWLDWDGLPSYTTTFAKERNETNAATGWTYLRGYWRLEDGGYHGSGPGDNETYSGDIRWADYTVSTELTPLLGDYHQVNARVQGALRCYAFGLAPNGRVALYKKDRTYTEVASAPFDWQQGQCYRLSLTVSGDTLAAVVEGDEGSVALRWQDADAPYLTGQIGLSTRQAGHTRFTRVEVGSA